MKHYYSNKRLFRQLISACRVNELLLS
jgi:hypothetical protein